MADAAVAARSPEAARLSDLMWLGAAVVLFIGTGLGTRAPWPADEPRFALIAREMVHTGQWLFPRIGGDLYPDKPPVYFWLLSVCYFVTGSLRASFLIPAFVGACTIVGLVYDLGRRIAGRMSGLAAAGTLACSVQFLMTMRGAQIDPVLCAFTTLSLYGLLRHLLFGPAWGWYFVGGVAAGIGVVTKGVGFLPLLALIPYAVLRARGFNVMGVAPSGLTAGAGQASVARAGFEPAMAQGPGTPASAVKPSKWRWALVAAGFLAGTAVWFVPMMVAVATRNDPALVAYRNEILFQQTVHRYAAAWHHVEPWYYFIVDVIPGLWLPFSLLLFWLVPRWRAAWREKDARVWLPLTWVLLTLLFFSLSAGKRGIYLFPALPGLAIAAAPYLPDLFRRRGVQWASLILGGALVLVAAGVLAVDAFGGTKLRALAAAQGVDSLGSIAAIAVLGAIAWCLAFWKRPILAWPAVLASVAVVWSYGITPHMDGERSARDFTKKALAQVPIDADLGLLAYKEQFLLYLDRPITNFGHARWREGEQEADDASAWLSESARRVLLVPESLLTPCFAGASKQPAGDASGDRWFLVQGQPEHACVAKGDRSRAIRYRPPIIGGD
ncbi:MAG: glycosyltransferase family 39 protein [Gammaproteobacteria bacterium]